VLAAARAAFAERGFDGASIRAIAGAADVDPALVHHYFGTKDKLFLAAVVRMVLRVWDGPARPAVLALVRSAITHEFSARLLREFVLATIIRRVVGSFDMPVGEREARGALVASQVIGLVVSRYVLRLEPLASADAEQVVAAVGPTVQRYLTGDVELPA